MPLLYTKSSDDTSSPFRETAKADTVVCVMIRVLTLSLPLRLHLLLLPPSLSLYKPKWPAMLPLTCQQCSCFISSIYYFFWWELFTSKQQHGRLLFPFWFLFTYHFLTQAHWTLSSNSIPFSPATLFLFYFSPSTRQILEIIDECVYCRLSPTKIWTPIISCVTSVLWYH